MRASAMRTRLQLQTSAAPVPSELFKVCNQLFAGAGGTFCFVDHKIVYIETPSNMSIFKFAKYRDTNHALVQDGHAHFAAFGKDLLHFFQIASWQLRTQLPVNLLRLCQPLLFHNFPAASRNLHDAEWLFEHMAS